MKSNWGLGTRKDEDQTFLKIEKFTSLLFLNFEFYIS